MTFPAYGINGKNASSTTVPTGFRNAWFSADLENVLPHQKALIHAKITERGFRNKRFSITAALVDGQKPCFFGEMERLLLGAAKSPMSSRKTTRICTRSRIGQTSTFFPSNLVRFPGVPDYLPVHLQEYVLWMKIKANQHTATTQESAESLCRRLEDVDVESRLLARVARNLPTILCGETDR